MRADGKDLWFASEINAVARTAVELGLRTFVASWAVPSEDRTLPQSQKIRLAMSHMGQLQTCTKPKGTSALHPNADIRDAHDHVR